MASTLFLEEKDMQATLQKCCGLFLGCNKGCLHPSFVRECGVVTLNRLVVIIVIVIIEMAFQCFTWDSQSMEKVGEKVYTLDLTSQGNDNIFRAMLENPKVI